MNGTLIDFPSPGHADEKGWERGGGGKRTSLQRTVMNGQCTRLMVFGTVRVLIRVF